jgi:hypothetical protein
VLPEIALLTGEIPLVPYVSAGTPALGDAVEPFLETHEAVPLAPRRRRWGPDLAKARIRMEKAWSLRPGSSWPPRSLGRVTGSPATRCTTSSG